MGTNFIKAAIDAAKKLPGQIVGAPVDISNLALGAVTGKGMAGFVPEPDFGSAKINRFFGMDPKSSGVAEDMVSTVLGFISPSGAAKTAVLATPVFLKSAPDFIETILKTPAGDLKPLYRGVKSDYPYPERTMPGIKGTGVYLTEDPSFASLYAQGATGGNVRVAYAKLKKPIVIEAFDGQLDKLNYMTAEQRTAWTKKQLDAGYDGVVVMDKGTAREVVVFDPANVKNALSTKE